jgi:hypothetical protein
MTLRLENDSNPIGKGRWRWSAWVEGSPDDLKAIESVTYRLHPTFPIPEVRVKTRKNKFKLVSSGWGEFSLTAEAHLTDGTSVHLEKWLTLAGISTAAGGEGRKTVFISYSIGDTDIASDLRRALAQQGLEVRTADQLVDACDEVTTQIGKAVRAADAVVAVVSDPPSRFIEQEALAAHHKGRFVIPVVVGNAKAEGPLSKISHIDFSDQDKVAEVAEQIASRIKGATVRET